MPSFTKFVGAIAYDYYTIEVPPDHLSDPIDRGHYAIYTAFNIARSWFVPCVWEVLSDDGLFVRVRRKRSKELSASQ